MVELAKLLCAFHDHLNATQKTFTDHKAREQYAKQWIKNFDRELERIAKDQKENYNYRAR